MDNKESIFMGFECPLRDEKKLLIAQEKLDSVLRSISSWSPSSVLNLEMWILKMRVPHAQIFWILEILHFKIRKWTENELTSPKKYPFLMGQPSPLNWKIYWPPPKTQNSKISTPLNLTGGAHYAFKVSTKLFKWKS